MLQFPAVRVIVWGFYSLRLVSVDCAYIYRTCVLSPTSAQTILYYTAVIFLINSQGGFIAVHTLTAFETHMGLIACQ